MSEVVCDKKTSWLF